MLKYKKCKENEIASCLYGIHVPDSLHSMVHGLERSFKLRVDRNWETYLSKSRQELGDLMRGNSIYEDILYIYIIFLSRILWPVTRTLITLWTENTSRRTPSSTAVGILATTTTPQTTRIIPITLVTGSVVVAVVAHLPPLMLS